MFKKLVASLLLALCICACQPKQAPEIISEKSPFGDFCLSVDTVRIRLTEKETFIYPKFGTTEHNDSLYLVGYNHLLHAFDLFNLDEERFVKRIFMDREGPNGIPDIIGFTPIGISSFYILSSNELLKLNDDGMITEKVSINNETSTIRNHKPSENMFWLDKNKPLYYDTQTNSIFGRNYSYQYGQCNPQRYDSKALIAKVDLNKSKWSTIPIRYPSNMSSESYGFMTQVHTEWTHKELIYSFEFDPNIYVMNRSTGEIAIYNGSSELTNNSVSTMTWSECHNQGKRMEHYIRQVNFGGVLKDNYRGLHYRFHKKGLPPSVNALSNMNKKKLFLSIFDESYAKVGEIPLYDRLFPSDISFVGKRGLYLAAPENTDATLVFYILRIESVPKTQKNELVL